MWKYSLPRKPGTGRQEGGGTKKKPALDLARESDGQGRLTRGGGESLLSLNGQAGIREFQHRMSREWILQQRLF